MHFIASCGPGKLFWALLHIAVARWQSLRAAPGMARQPRTIATTVLLAAVCCNLALGQTPPSSAVWTPVNAGLPYSFFGITTLTVDPSTPSTLYAMAPRGGLFKSIDAAASWKAVIGVVGLSFLAIDPNNSSTIYAATQYGVAKSIDGGESWNAAIGNLTDNCFMLAIDPVTSTTVYGLCSGGMFKTTDGGEIWQQIHAPPNHLPGMPTSFGSLVIDPTAPSTIYASVSSAEIIKSTDSGENWVTIKTGIPFSLFNTTGALVIDPRNPSNLYAGSFAASGVSTAPGVPPLDFGTGGISRSTDGGQTWITVRDGIPSEAFVASLALDPASPSTIYAGYSRSGMGGILKSTDEGQSWTAINTDGFTSAIVAVDPRTPSTIYAGYSTHFGTGTISKSSDAGSSWQLANEGLAYYDLHVLAIDPVSATTVYTGGAGGLFKSDDAGRNWSNLATFHVSSGYPIGSGMADVRSLIVNFKNPIILYVETLPVDGGCAFDEKDVFKSTDGGATWSDNISPETSGCMLGALSSSTLMAMDASDPDTLYLAETDDMDGYYALLKSADGGANWTIIWNGIWSDPSGLNTGLKALAIDPVTPTTLYAGLNTGVFKSTDGGTSWNLTALKSTFVNALTIDRTNPSTLYAAATTGLFKSTDAGGSWVAINGGLTSLTAVVIAPNDSNIVYAATSGDGIYKSIDGGGNWVRFNAGLTNLNIRALAIAPGTPTKLYVATPSGVLRTVEDASQPSPALWQQAITAMKTAAGTKDGLNFWQWAWYWQRSVAFPGAPAGFGVPGSIDDTPQMIDKIVAIGGGDGFRIVSAEQWVTYYRQAALQ